MSASETREVEQDLVKAIEKAKSELEKLNSVPPEKRWFHLEYRVVSPLYYRLEKHLLDWCSNEHPVQRTKYGQHRISNNLKFNDIEPLKLYDGNLHQLESSQGTDHNTDQH